MSFPRHFPQKTWKATVRQQQQQILFEDDNQKGKGNRNSISSSRMTTKKARATATVKATATAKAHWGFATLTNGFLADRFDAGDILQQVVGDSVSLLEIGWTVVGEPDFIVLVLPDERLEGQVDGDAW